MKKTSALVLHVVLLVASEMPAWAAKVRCVSKLNEASVQLVEAVDTIDAARGL